MTDDVESLIAGSEKLTEIFGSWPSFHDAEILNLDFWRGEVVPERDLWVFPVLTLLVHVWEMTRETDSEGYLVLRKHTRVTLRFRDVSEFRMSHFNHINTILELSIEKGEAKGRGLTPFLVGMEGALGFRASFKCFYIDVVAAAPCDASGRELV